MFSQSLDVYNRTVENINAWYRVYIRVSVPISGFHSGDRVSNPAKMAALGGQKSRDQAAFGARSRRSR